MQSLSNHSRMLPFGVLVIIREGMNGMTLFPFSVSLLRSLTVELLIIIIILMQNCYYDKIMTKNTGHSWTQELCYIFISQTTNKHL